MNDEQQSLDDKLYSRWWGQLLMAVFFFGLASFVYWYLNDLESSGRSARINWIVALIYNFAGKWGCVLLFAVPGLILWLMGIWNLVSRRGARD